MKARGAAIQGGLAALGLVAAYATWQREPERAPGEVVILDINKSEVKKVRWDGGDGKWAEMERVKEGGEPRVLLKVSANPGTKTPERKLYGNEYSERLVDRLGPLVGTRALGILAPDKLKEVGLDAPKRKFEVTTTRGQSYTFLVGTAPQGASDPYVQDQRDKRVYVVGGGVVADLEAANLRFVERNLHGFKAADFDTISVSADGKMHELTQPASGTPFPTQLVAKKTGKPDALAKNWHDKVWRLQLVDVLGQGELPAEGAPPVTCRVEYRAGGKSTGFLELGRVQPAQSTASVAPGAIFARTEHTPSWGRLPGTAEDVLRECAKVAASE